MMDLDREQFRKTYLLSRLGFALLAGALVLACGTALLDLFGSFEPGLVLRIERSTWFSWIDLPIVWGSLVGASLLWGRWEAVSWQRRAGLLLVMSLADVVLWVLDHGDALAPRELEIGHEWLRYHLGGALGWAEFALLASLASDYLGHLGVEEAADSAKAVRSMAATGAVIWMLVFCERTHWGGGWPLRPHRPIRAFETLLLMHGWKLIWTITLIQVTALVIAATRQSSRVLEEMQREDEANDPLRSRSVFGDEQDPFAFAGGRTV
ncbi:MAG TPA: hypothetical protein VFF52_17735 [Isosphaeraceae bacterium]|nr:hypothetical protein [Isosphaeraceae bacterium]